MDRDAWPRALIVYTSQRAQTKAMAIALGEHLERDGIRAELVDVDTQSLPDLADFDAVVIGSSLQFGRHPASLCELIAHRREILAAVPSFFFSVGMDDNGGIARATGWTPTHSAVLDRRTLDRRRFRHKLGGNVPSPAELAHAESEKLAALATAIRDHIDHVPTARRIHA